jgi:putative sterol carrier protein
LEEVLNQWLAKAKKRLKTDEKMQEEIKEFDGVFQLDVTDGESYYVSINNGEVGDLIKGKADTPKITVTSDSETIKALMSGELGVMKAFALKKFKLKGDFKDIIRMRKFLKSD